MTEIHASSGGGWAGTYRPMPAPLTGRAGAVGTEAVWGGVRASAPAAGRGPVRTGGGLGVEVSRSDAGDRSQQQGAQEGPQTFGVRPGTRLLLRDLPGPAQVSTGAAGTISVTVRGEASARQEIRVEHTGTAVQVSGPRSSTGGMTFVSGNSVTSIGSVSGRVIINGVDVTAAVNGRGGAGVEPARVEVVVPAGTGVEVEDCVRTQVYDVAGPVWLDLSGQCGFAARGATRARVDLSGQCVVRLLGGRGDVEVDGSGQCQVEVEGSYDELQVDVSGQCRVDARGVYRSVRGDASGMSHIAVTGQVERHSLRASGMSSATVNGRSVAR